MDTFSRAPAKAVRLLYTFNEKDFLALMSQTSNCATIASVDLETARVENRPSSTGALVLLTIRLASALRPERHGQSAPGSRWWGSDRRAGAHRRTVAADAQLPTTLAAERRTGAAGPAPPFGVRGPTSRCRRRANRAPHGNTPVRPDRSSLVLRVKGEGPPTAACRDDLLLVRLAPSDAVHRSCDPTHADGQPHQRRSSCTQLSAAPRPYSQDQRAAIRGEQGVYRVARG